MILSLFTLAFTAFHQYRVRAAEADGALLPATEKPVEPGEYYADVNRWSKELIGRPETHILINAVC
jgi:hypothetical protein